MQWMHFTIVWLIGSILTTLGVFVANKQSDGFFSLIIPVIVVGTICWKVTRKDLQFVYEERSRDFFSYMSCMMLLAVAMLMNTGLRYSTGEKAKVDRLTAHNAKQYDYLEVMDLELDTSKTGTYVYQRVQRDRYSTNLEFEGILVIQVKGLNDVYVTREAISSCSYDYASNEEIEETYQEVIEKLQKIKEKTPLHSHCYLSKFDKNESTGYQNTTKAVIESGINDPGEEDNFVFFGISPYDDGNPLWKNIKISGIVLAIWMMITGAAFRFTKEKKHRRIRTKDEPSTKGGKTDTLNLLVRFWPVTAILLACIIMFVVELAMGYDETSLGGEILYKLVRGTEQLCDIRRPAMVALVYLCVPSRQLPSSLREHLVVADSLVLHDARSKAYGTSRRLLSLKPVLRPCVSCLLAGHCRRSQRRHLRHGGHLYNSVPVHLDKNGTTTRRACCHWSYLHNKSASQLCTDHEHDRTHKRAGMWLHDCHRHHHL